MGPFFANSHHQLLDCRTNEPLWRTPRNKEDDFFKMRWRTGFCASWVSSNRDYRTSFFSWKADFVTDIMIIRRPNSTILKCNSKMGRLFYFCVILLFEMSCIFSAKEKIIKLLFPNWYHIHTSSASLRFAKRINTRKNVQPQSMLFFSRNFLHH